VSTITTNGTDIVAARPMSVPVGQEVNDLARIASNLAASGIYKKVASTPEALFAILLAARDLGVSATAALAGGIHMVEGKPETSANLQAQLLREYRGPEGQRYDFRILTPVTNRAQECHIQFSRREAGEAWEVIGEELFTLDDAKVAGLAGKDNYKKYPKMMLLARCLSDGIASHCPETARGLRVYGQGEIGGGEAAPPLDRGPADAPLDAGAVDLADVDVIDVEARQPPAPDAPAVTPTPTEAEREKAAAYVRDCNARTRLLELKDDLAALRQTADKGMDLLGAPLDRRGRELRKADTEDALRALIETVNDRLNGASA
jgi:hypothetical protein